MLDYSSLKDCAGFVEDKVGYDDDLETLLQVSASTADGETYYRPYYIASVLLSRQAHDNVLIKAKNGLTFRDPERTIKGWLDIQASLDRAFSLTVPAGFESVTESTQRAVSAAPPIFVNWR